MLKGLKQLLKAFERPGLVQQDFLHRQLLRLFIPGEEGGFGWLEASHVTLYISL